MLPCGGSQNWSHFIKNYRWYRPWASQENLAKIEAIRVQLANQNILTGDMRSGVANAPSGTSLDQAITILKPTTSNAAPKTLSLHAKVNLLKEQSNGIRSSITLPHPISRDSIRILVLAPSNLHSLAHSNGAHIVGSATELIDQLITNALTFNRCIATPDQLPTLMKLARVLGPKGLMPSVKSGTLTDDISGAITNALGSVPFKIEKCAGLLNMSIAKSTFSYEQVKENVLTMIEHLKSLAKTPIPSTSKAKYIERVHLGIQDHPAILIAESEYYPSVNK